MNIQNIVDTAITVITQAGLRIVGAFILWLAGRWLIRLVHDVAARALVRQQVDATSRNSRCLGASGCRIERQHNVTSGIMSGPSGLDRLPSCSV